MTDFDYPPARERSLGAALATAEDRIADIDAEENPGEARRARNQRDALRWAVDEFGEDATVELQAYTATTRARVLDTLRDGTLGEFGSEEKTIWLAAAGTQSAPWLDDHEIASKATVTGQLPPALVEWVWEQLDDLNDLSEGN